ncbi:DUF4167 domain-containing protein [Maricaulis sp.]|uniref:DUF4167 domain-containing protein n=1 Tax=Maricaulis sp. TaxID=1486257 RepID=UPI002624B80B|nr:DUF4167 domain-containing protein [Maricaulis sp.]
MKRQRGRGRKSGGNPANRSYESNGPEVKIRGNASQIYEKYLTLARDATSSGDRVRAENLYQHAEHYFRIVQANQPKRDPEAEDGAENTEAQGEDGEGEQQPQREERGRGRGRNNRRRGGDAPQADTSSEDGADPLGVVTPEGDAASDGEAPSAEAGEGEENAPRRRTRRPRRPRQSSDEGAAEASSENADATPSEGSDSENEAA